MDQSDFKHITVSAPDDEDVVVWAGAGRSAEEHADEQRRGSAGSAQDAKPAGTSEHAAEPSAEKTASPQVEDTPSPQAEGGEPASAVAAPAPATAVPVTKPAARQQGKTGEEYRPTTLADLEREPMSMTQRVVIIAAVVCIIGAIVYCLTMMG